MSINLESLSKNVFLLLATAGLLAAQSNAIDAAIEGYIRDASAAAVSGAHVNVRNTATNVVIELPPPASDK